MTDTAQADAAPSDAEHQRLVERAKPIARMTMDAFKADNIAFTPETLLDTVAFALALVFDQAKSDTATNRALREHVASLHPPASDSA
mgnify:CR=1 FL=1|jgi:hypothetical protein|tara:strand:+ start:187 stop:447 length:261 start_codon:yes stop_codon:yes gene_type:complete